MVWESFLVPRSVNRWFIFQLHNRAICFINTSWLSFLSNEESPSLCSYLRFLKASRFHFLLSKTQKEYQTMELPLLYFTYQFWFCVVLLPLMHILQFSFGHLYMSDHDLAQQISDERISFSVFFNDHLHTDTQMTQKFRFRYAQFLLPFNKILLFNTFWVTWSKYFFFKFGKMCFKKYLHKYSKCKHTALKMSGFWDYACRRKFIKKNLSLCGPSKNW